jgi:hypothetical protein
MKLYRYVTYRAEKVFLWSELSLHVAVIITTAIVIHSDLSKKKLIDVYFEPLKYKASATLAKQPRARYF